LPLETKEVLDIGCGPGAWALALAKEYPEVEVVGVDLSDIMISYAQAQAKIRKINNITFQVMDIRALDFEPERFDFINVRLIGAALRKEDWTTLWQRCFTMLRPGGQIRWSEADVPQSSSPAYDEFYVLLTTAMKRLNQTFSNTGNTIGILPRMIPMLMAAGFVDIDELAYALDSSSYTALWQGGLEISIAFLHLIKPLLLRTHLIDEEQFTQLFEQAVQEMQAPDYVALSLMLSIWARKP
jgi:ubiquinone/menaquinone biosynthesis C-methylase UbiE